MRTVLVGVALAGLVLGTGCARWGQQVVYGQARESGRRMLGSPQVATSTTASGSAGFGTFSSNRGRHSSTTGGLSGSSGAMSRTHCIQEAEITYEQPYDLSPVVVGRTGDVVGGVVLIALGLSVIGGAAIAAQDTFDPGDPLYDEGADPTFGYAIGAGMIGGGIGWMAYSYTALPKGPPPPVKSDLRTWTETKFVESTGCGLVPGDRAPGASPGSGGNSGAGGDIKQRLEKLEELHRSGLISDDEYERKRAELLEQL